MQDEAIYRCINPSCKRPMPRPVNFCPYCGTAQSHAQARAPDDASGTQAGSLARPEAVAAASSAAAGASAALSGWSDAPPASNRGAGAGAGQGSSGQGGGQPGAGAAASDQAPPAKPMPTPSATSFGRSGTTQPASNQSSDAGAAPHRPSAPPRSPGVSANASLPPRQAVPRPPIPARPQSQGPQGRQPVQLRWWILALAILWGVWLLAKPSARKIERQIDHAVDLAKACKGSEAQAELIALRSSRATLEQLAQLQRTLNDQSAVCTKRRQRNKAWVEASAAAESALAAGSVDKARSRLNGFIRRWGEDGKTRELKERIDARREDHPLAVPPDRA